MKKIIYISLCVLLFSACGNDSAEEILPEIHEKVKDSIPVLKGDFIYLSNSAVLKGEDFIYGIKIDSLAQDLANQVELLKTDDFEMIPVVVRAKILKNPKSKGWDEIIEIRKIVEVPKAKENPTKEEQKQ